jgi:hypothetical protein
MITLDREEVIPARAPAQTPPEVHPPRRRLNDKAVPANVLWIGLIPTGDLHRINYLASMLMSINRSSISAHAFADRQELFLEERA